jgi:hypothetical protein
MRTTVDIPDSVYRELKVCAASEGTSVKKIILDCVAVRFLNARAPAKQEGRPRFPVIRSMHPGSLKLDEEGAYEDEELDGEVPRKVNRLTQPILESYAPSSIRLDVGEKPVRKLQLPLIHSSRPGTLELTNEQIDELAAFN